MKMHHLIFVVLAFTSCDSLRTFEIEQKSETTVERGTIVEQLVGNMGFGEFLNMDLSDNQQMKNNDAQKEHIEKASLTLLELTIAQPTNGQDFTFLDSLEFYVESNKNPKKRIAYKDTFEAGQKKVQLELENLELAPYATEETMDISTEVTGRRPDNDTTIEAILKLEIVAK